MLVYVFLLASMSVWNLTFNNVIVVHLLASLGLSVLYSVHIALTFLLVEAPKVVPTMNTLENISVNTIIQYI